MNEITIIVKSGMVQDVKNIPDNVTVAVRDYDIDNLPDKYFNILKDENGDRYMKTIYYNGEIYES